MKITQKTITELKHLAQIQFPTLKRCYPRTLKVITNPINNHPMYAMRIMITCSNGIQKIPLLFTVYCNQRIREIAGQTI